MRSAFDPVGLEEYYVNYIDSKNDDNYQNRYIGNESYYHASAAGFCSRKMYYESVEQIKPTNEVESTSKIRMRFGSIFHDDFQQALVNNYNIYNNIDNNIDTNIYNKEKDKVLSKKKVKFHVEQEIVIPELNVRGFYDIVAQQEEDGEERVYLYDLKTIGSYPWKRKFGLGQDDSFENYKLQLGTYGIAVEEQFGRIDGMYLYFYNKDTSAMKNVFVHSNYINLARNYWRNIIKEHEKGVPQFMLGVSPVEKWGCGYCSFKDHCNPPDYKNKRGK